MLTHVYINQFSRPADSLVYGGMAVDLELSPPYQRDSVWTLEQRRNLIKSLLEGLPIGAVFLNHRDIMHSYVVDGKQRIETLRLFMDDAFKIPSLWVSDSHGEVSFSEMEKKFQRHISNAIIATYETQMKTEQEEADLYLRINYGGTQHDPL